MSLPKSIAIALISLTGLAWSECACAAPFALASVSDRAADREGNGIFAPFGDGNPSAQVYFSPGVPAAGVPSLEGRYALEFDLRRFTSADALTSARLALFPDAHPFRGTKLIDIATYSGDGVVRAGDFAAGQLIAGPIGVTDQLPVVVDVTTAIAAAMAVKQPYIGFVVRLHDLTGSPLIPFQTTDAVDVNSHPALLLDYAATPFLPGDANGDGEVNRGDLAVVTSHFGQGGLAPGAAAGDVNGDGSVNVLDVIEVRNHFPISAFAPASSPANSVIPEPSTVVLVCIALAAIVCAQFAKGR